MKEILEYVIRYVIKKIDDCDPVLLRVQMENVLRLLSVLPSYSVEDAIVAILREEPEEPEEQEAEDA